MEMHKCKVCFKKFMSGRALGGHMSRSHFTKLPLPQKIFQEKKEKLVELTESNSNSNSAEFCFKGGVKGVGYVLRKKPRKSFKVIDNPEFFDAGSDSVVVHDIKTESETETESTESRRKGTKMMDDEVSWIASDEDVALFLVMLSRGECKLYGKHRCEVCKEVFKSSQALGGHRLSHRNLGIKKQRNNSKKPRNVDGSKVHECPHCGKLFGSGQALGGHKRSHLDLVVNTSSCSSSLVGLNKAEKFEDGLIDLNVPAPIDDDYGGDGFSQQEASAVSVAD